MLEHPPNARTYISAAGLRYRIGILAALLGAALVGLLLVGPMPQSAAYHGFADTRSWLGMANFGNVASNLPFALIGGYGMWRVLGPGGQEIFGNRIDRYPYALFFLGVGLICAGSAYYHAVPDNSRLFWDRLPMTIAFMALFSAFIVDRIHHRIGVQWFLPILIVAGIASVYYWDWSESAGQGDLRFYGLVQFYPIVALPVLCWLFPRGHYTGGRYLVWLMAWYAAAKLLETFDRQVFAVLDNAISGHSLKHLASFIAVTAVIRMLARRRPNSIPKST